MHLGRMLTKDQVRLTHRAVLSAGIACWTLREKALRRNRLQPLKRQLIQLLFRLSLLMNRLARQHLPNRLFTPILPVHD